MAAKVQCKKGYDTTGKDGYVEFKKNGENELCPVSNSSCCEDCKAAKIARE